MNPVVIVGGGISGLSTAWWLRKNGIEVTVLEKEQSCGGSMKTIRSDGWLIEQGPNSALETTPLFGRMFEELGIAGEQVHANPRANRRYILRDGTLHPLPMSPVSFVTSDLWSLSGKLRLLMEPFVGRGNRDESIAEFVARRLGQEFLDYAIDPFVAGVYAGNPERLSARVAFPKLFALEEKYGGLIQGMIRGRKERRRRTEQSKNRARLFSFREGMEVFPRALVNSMPDRVITGCETTRVSIGQEGGNRFLEVHFLHEGKPRALNSSAVVLAAPAHSLARTIQHLSPVTASRLQSVFYPPVVEVFLGFRKEQIGRDLDGFGFLVPGRENRRILGTIWSSSLFEGRAPDGHVALTTFIGGSRQPWTTEIDDGGLRSLVHEELGSILGLRGEPVIASITRWPKAIPQYEVGYDAVLQAIEQSETEIPGLFFCANFKGGIAVGDCVMNSEKTASRVLEYCNRVHHRTPAATVESDF